GEWVAGEVVGGGRDGIGGDDQIAVADVDDGGVLAHARSHHDVGIARRVFVENGLQQIAGKLPEWQRRHRARSIPWCRGAPSSSACRTSVRAAMVPASPPWRPPCVPPPPLRSPT